MGKRLVLFVESFVSCLEEVKDKSVLRKVFDAVYRYGGVLVGGVAVALYVRGRVPTEREFDFLIFSDGFNELYQELIDEGLSLVETGMRKGFDYYVMYLDGLVVDFLVDVYDEWRGVDYVVMSIKGMKVRVIVPEWLVALKYHAGRGKDFADIVLLLRSGKCDLRKLRRIMLEQFGEDEWEEVKLIYEEVVERGLELKTMKRWFE
ncbi:MAG: hypothetical protein QXR17_06900 [Candidatus Bathyarchaeia archaeon]